MNFDSYLLNPYHVIFVLQSLWVQRWVDMAVTFKDQKSVAEAGGYLGARTEVVELLKPWSTLMCLISSM